MKATNSAQDPSAAKPAHIEHPKTLTEALRRQQNKVGSDLAAQAKKQAVQHQRLNKVADAGNRK